MVKSDWRAIGIAAGVALILGGCSLFRPPPEKTAIPVVVNGPKPELAVACTRSIPALKKIPMPDYERRVVEQYAGLSDEKKIELLRKQAQRILELLEIVIADRTQRAIDIDNARTCRAHVMRVHGKE